MTTYDETQPLSVRDTAKGIAVRAGVLSVVTLVLGAFLFSLAAKVASGAVKVVAGLLILAIGGGFATWEVKKMQRRLSDRNEPAELA